MFDDWNKQDGWQNKSQKKNQTAIHPIAWKLYSRHHTETSSQQHTLISSIFKSSRLQINDETYPMMIPIGSMALVCIHLHYICLIFLYGKCRFACLLKWSSCRQIYRSSHGSNDDMKATPSALRRTAKLLRDVRVSGLGLWPEKPVDRSWFQQRVWFLKAAGWSWEDVVHVNLSVCVYGEMLCLWNQKDIERYCIYIRTAKLKNSTFPNFTFCFMAPEQLQPKRKMSWYVKCIFLLVNLFNLPELSSKVCSLGSGVATLIREALANSLDDEKCDAQQTSE